MKSIRVQIHLKYMFDEQQVEKELYPFWYAFQPTAMSTINDLLDDIRTNYLTSQLSTVIDNIEQAFIIHLDDCQLLPVTSSEILRDNDRLT
jgi:hypothetical protein